MMSGDPSYNSQELFEVLLPPTEYFTTWDPYTSSPPLNRLEKQTPPAIAKSRKLVHRDKDWHSSSHVWLLDPCARKILLQKRSIHKDTFPGRWDISAAGHVTFGNSPRITALQEVEEELGIVIADDRLEFAFCIPAAMADLGGCNCYEYVYFVIYDSTTKSNKKNYEMRLNAGEVDAVKWIDLEEFEKSLANGDEMVVPRAPDYAPLFFAKASSLIKTRGFSMDK